MQSLDPSWVSCNMKLNFIKNQAMVGSIGAGRFSNIIVLFFTHWWYSLVEGDFLLLVLPIAGWAQVHMHKWPHHSPEKSSRQCSFFSKILEGLQLINAIMYKQEGELKCGGAHEWYIYWIFRMSTPKFGSSIGPGTGSFPCSNQMPGVLKTLMNFFSLGRPSFQESEWLTLRKVNKCS